jgi:hypothetical protein
MSIYAKNFILDELTSEPKIVKHLNKKRIDRGGWNQNSNGKSWNKSGKRARINKTRKLHTDKERKFWKLKIKKFQEGTETIKIKDNKMENKMYVMLDS